MIILRVVRGVATHFVTRWGEWIKAGASFAIGVQLLQPSHLFAEPVYSVMASMGDEDLWGMILVVIGTLRLLALAINGTFRAFGLHAITPLVRATLAFLSAGVWFALTWGYWAAFPEGLGFIMTGALMLCDIGLCLNITREAGFSDQRSRQHGIRR